MIGCLVLSWQIVTWHVQRNYKAETSLWRFLLSRCRQARYFSLSFERRFYWRYLHATKSWHPAHPKVHTHDNHFVVFYRVLTDFRHNLHCYCKIIWLPIAGEVTLMDMGEYITWSTQLSWCKHKKINLFYGTGYAVFSCLLQPVAPFTNVV